MNPEAGQILSHSADQLLGQVLPELAVPYLQGSTAIIAILMKLVAREYENGAEIRAQENSDMRALFAELAPALRDAALKSKLEAAATRDESLAISALNAANVELRRLLIAAHVHIEAIGDSNSERRIWRVLKAMAARRALSLS